MYRVLEVIGFGGLGTTELLIILGILLFIFGASRIPELGRSLGSGIRGFQKAIKGQDEPKQLESTDTEASGDQDESDSEQRG